MRTWRGALIGVFLGLGSLGVSCTYALTHTGLVKGGDPLSEDPVVIHAQQEIIVDQKASVGWAHGDPEAWQKDTCLKGDVLKALFNPETRKVQQIEALGHMHLYSPTQSLEGRQGMYHVVFQYMWSCGEPTILQDMNYTLTTQGTLQYWRQQGYGIATGRSCLELNHQVLWGDILTMQQKRASTDVPSEVSVIDKASAWGDVLAIHDKPPVSKEGTPLRSTAHGQRASYDAGQQKVMIEGHISCQQRQHHLQGAWAEIDLEHQKTVILAQDPVQSQPHDATTHLRGALLYPQRSP